LEQIVKAARAKGADALILESATENETGFSGSIYGGGFSGHFTHSPDVTAELIKYLTDKFGGVRVN
jgi:hypothetical protein